MNHRDLRIATIIGSIGAAGIIGTVLYATWYYPAVETIATDGAIIDKVKGLPEATAFVSRYPKAQPVVTRGSYVIVVYEVSKSTVTGIPWNGTVGHEPKAELSFSLNNNLVVDYVAFACLIDGRVAIATSEGIVAYLRSEEKDCWDDSNQPASNVDDISERFMS